MAGINNIGNLSQVNAAEIGHEEESVGKEESPPQTDAASQVGSSGLVNQNLSNVRGEEAEGRSQVATPIARNAARETGPVMPDPSSEGLRRALSEKAKPVTLKGPTGANGGPAPSVLKDQVKELQDNAAAISALSNDLVKSLADPKSDLRRNGNRTEDQVKELQGQAARADVWSNLLAKSLADPENIKALRMAQTGKKDIGPKEPSQNLKTSVANTANTLRRKLTTFVGKKPPQN